MSNESIEGPHSIVDNSMNPETLLSEVQNPDLPLTTYTTLSELLLCFYFLTYIMNYFRTVMSSK